MKILNFLKSLGPGLLYAGAAVGVSHLVQSTRAGASYGFDLIWILIIANVIKYPFFEFAPRYASSTGKSLIHGYSKVGKWALVLYAMLTVATMFAITAAIAMVTAGLLNSLVGWSLSTPLLSMIIMVFTMLFLMIGKFKTLEGAMKYIILILTLSTLVAVVFSFKTSLPVSNHFNWSQTIDIAFLIAFLGWMPAPIDVSVWHSTWTEAKQKNLKAKLDLKSSIQDFKIGYIGTGFLALGFLSLGAFVMYGSGEELSANSTKFAGQLVRMYTHGLGSWAFYLIGIAAFTTMLSTSITVMDAYPRVLKPTFQLLFSKSSSPAEGIDKTYMFWMVLLMIGAWTLILWSDASMKAMVDMATTISFVTAPLLAILNYWAVMSIRKEDQPKPWLQIYAWIGMLFLSIFSVYYIIWKFL